MTGDASNTPGVAPFFGSSSVFHFQATLNSVTFDRLIAASGE
jgi:hypothetical protein